MSSSTEAPARLWPRVRATFGPAAAGLVGGAAAGLLALPAIGPLCRNMALAYSRYPTLPRPWVAGDVELPGWLSLIALLVGLAVPVAMGIATVWLVRPRDVWADLSAGVTTALAGSVAAFVTCVGWPVVLALVVVPSISDLTLMSDSVRPAAATEAGAAHPSDALARRYADLQGVAPDERGGAMMAKIVSDQASGGASAVAIGMLVSLLTAGSLALAGTLTAGYLWRRDHRFAVIPYLELTLPVTVMIALVTGVIVAPLWSWTVGDNPFAPGVWHFGGLMIVSAVMIAGVVRRWPALVRVSVTVAWLAVLLHWKTPSMPWFVPVAAVILAGFLLWRQFAARRVEANRLASQLVP